jgi:hypothetical protein
MLTLTGFFLAVQVSTILGLAGKGYLDYARSVGTTTGFWIVYTFLEAKYALYMNNGVRGLVMVAIISDGVFGYYFNYYATSFVFDKILHLFGTYALALFAYILVLQMLNQPVSRSVKAVLVISLGLSIGASYEILEFLVDHFANPVIPSQPSLLDTDLDLICDSLGAILAAGQVTLTRFSPER